MGGNYVMEYPKIDMEKLPKVMDLIDEAASLMERQGIKENKELECIEKQLQLLTGKSDLRVIEFHHYWAAQSLETVAKEALFEKPQKRVLQPEEIREMVIHILEQEEAVMDWQLHFLEVCTKLDVTDYIFYPDDMGLSREATLEEIAEKMILDMQQ